MSHGFSPAVAAMLLLLCAQTIAASAQEKITVTGLIGDGYQVVGSFLTNIGPGIFLQKSGSLFLCFVTERRETTEIETNYCKAVR